MIKKLTCTLLLAFAASIAFAQPDKIRFETYNVAEGLPEEFVRGLVQDNKGFIWFCTQNGLVKYDGYQFKVYSVAAAKTDTTSLHIKNLGGGLLIARDGKLWIGETSGSGGIASFDPITEKFRNYQNPENTIQRNNSGSILLFEDEKGNIWFKYGFNRTVFSGRYITCRLNPTTGKIKAYPLGDINEGNVYLSKAGTVESSNTVWLLDDKRNFHKWNRQKDSFELIIPAGKILSPGVTDTLLGLSKGSGNRLYLSGRHSLYIFDSKTQKIIKSYLHSSGDANSIADSLERNIVEDQNGHIWITHRGGKLSLIDPATDKIQTYSYGSGPLYYKKGPQKIRSFFGGLRNKQGIWFQAWGIDFGVKFFVQYRFDTKTFHFYDDNFNMPANSMAPNRFPHLFLEDHTGLLWLGTRPGLYKQAPKKQQMDLFRFRADDPNGLPSDSIRELFEDSKKRLWIGTRNGLALYQPGQENFRVFKNNPANAASLSNNVIRTVCEDANGKIWVGTENGLNLWQESTGTFRRIFYSPTEKFNCRFIFPDKQQRLWLSVWDKGVFVLDKNTGRVIKSFLPDDKNPSSLTSKKISVFYQDSRGTIWLGDDDDNAFGLYKLNPAEDGFTHYLPIPGDETSISSNEISFVAEDEKKRLWIGTDGGLDLFDRGQNRFTRFYSPKLTSVNYFTTDKKGLPWFATYSGGGLASVNPDNGAITSYGEPEGLLQHDISPGLNGRLAKDNFGRIWLPTQRGLSIFDPETKTFASYFEKDGFQPYDRSYRVINTQNGDIWIGGSKGLNHIVPANLLKKDSTLPSLVITQVTINDSLYSKPDGTIFKQSIAYTDNFKLAYWQKNISFDFVALHYLRSEDNLYSWKLENYDKNWSAPAELRKASYSNLPPGKYVFRVKASNADGVWNEEGIAITITILPPWWKTWWAYTIYALLFLFALRLFSQYRERRLRKEKEMLQEKVEERTVELKRSLEDLQATQSQLIQSEKMASLGELTAGIAHEIQNPLNFMNNFSEVNMELLEEMKEELDKGNTPEAKSIADDVIKNEQKINFHGKRADAIVKGMLQHSRSGSSVKEPTDINALCDEYLRLAYHGLRAKDKSFNATMKTDFDTTIGNINIIPQDMGRVVLNLITNAFYVVDEKKKAYQAEPASPAGRPVEAGYEPTISVSTRKLGDKIEIKVADNGNGIPQKVLDKIFQPFFTTKPTGSGTGLGLSLSYDIVKAHGGDITVDTKEGKGSEFTISLPA